MIAEITLPRPPDLPGYTWRPPNREDAPRIHALLQAIEAIEPRAHKSDLDDRYMDFDDPDIHPETDALLAFTLTGEAVAIAWVESLYQETEQIKRAFLWGEVHPAHRRRGLGAFIMNWMEARARQILSATAPDLPGVMRTMCIENVPERIRLVQAHGFSAVRYFSRMRRDLKQPLPALVSPEGLEISNWTLEHDHLTWMAFNQAFRDHWGFAPAPESAWQMWITGHVNFRPDLSFLALKEGQVVSFCVCQVRKEENQALGILEAWIRDVGTLRAWRKQGLASILMGCAMQAARDAGFEFAGLNVDAENPTGALRLYEDLGFETILHTIAFEKPV